MQEVIKAIYEDGVIKPLKKLKLKEHEQVTITIETKDTVTKPKKTEWIVGSVKMLFWLGSEEWYHPAANAFENKNITMIPASIVCAASRLFHDMYISPPSEIGL